jgi:hypothetical protein
MGADMYITIRPQFSPTIIQNLCPQILLQIFLKRLEDFVVLLVGTQGFSDALPSHGVKLT